eukprot:5031296-Amphidinium_carterae.1
MRATKASQDCNSLAQNRGRFGKPRCVLQTTEEERVCQCKVTAKVIAQWSSSGKGMVVVNGAHIEKNQAVANGLVSVDIESIQVRRVEMTL